MVMLIMYKDWITPEIVPIYWFFIADKIKNNHILLYPLEREKKNSALTKREVSANENLDLKGHPTKEMHLTGLMHHLG